MGAWNIGESTGQLLAAFAAAWVAGTVNSMAGGGTLLTFPTLLALGLDSKHANATSSVGLLPGSIGGAFGYRRELSNGRRYFLPFFLPSIAGSVLGAALLYATDARTFDFLVPWLILSATLLFAFQKKIAAWFTPRPHEASLAPLPLEGGGVGGGGEAAPGATNSRPRGTIEQIAQAKSGESSLAASPPTPALPFRGERAKGQHGVTMVVICQFCVAVYGGYFGAGMGVLMLAVLGFLGIEDLHERNGLKNAAGSFINAVAAVIFIYGGLVRWKIAIVMAMASLAGGYTSTHLARRIGPTAVRAVVIVIGLSTTVWVLWRQIEPLLRTN